MGDNLWSISKLVYNDELAWVVLFWDNEKILEGFSFKSKGGAPDFSNPNDRMLLRMELLKKGWISWINSWINI